MNNAGIVRNRRKIEAAVHNAGRCLEVIDECGSLAALLWRVPACRAAAAIRARADWPAVTAGVEPPSPPSCAGAAFASSARRPPTPRCRRPVWSTTTPRAASCATRSRPSGAMRPRGWLEVSRQPRVRDGGLVGRHSSSTRSRPPIGADEARRFCSTWSSARRPRPRCGTSCCRVPSERIGLHARAIMAALAANDTHLARRFGDSPRLDARSPSQPIRLACSHSSPTSGIAFHPSNEPGAPPCSAIERRRAPRGPVRVTSNSDPPDPGPQPDAHGAVRDPRCADRSATSVASAAGLAAWSAARARPGRPRGRPPAAARPHRPLLILVLVAALLLIALARGRPRRPPPGRQCPVHRHG